MATTAGLREPFKTQVDELLDAADGKVTVTSGLRTYDEQLALRRKNGCPDPLHSPSSACRVPTAIPGTSKHEIGEAVDFGGNLDLAAHLAPIFHLIRTVPGELWHYELDPHWHPTPTEDDMFETGDRAYLQAMNGKLDGMTAGIETLIKEATATRKLLEERLPAPPPADAPTN